MHFVLLRPTVDLYCGGGRRVAHLAFFIELGKNINYHNDKLGSRSTFVLTCDKSQGHLKWTKKIGYEINITQPLFNLHFAKALQITT